MNQRILVVDDDESVLASLSEALAAVAGNRNWQVRPIGRSDSRAILYGAIERVDGDSTSLVSIREYSLGNSEGVVRTFGAAAACNSADRRSSRATVSLITFEVGSEYRSIPLRHAGEPRVVYTRPWTGQPIPTFSHTVSGWPSV